MTNRTSKKIILFANIVFSIFALSGCGGGSGGNSSATNATPVTQPVVANANLFQKSSIAPSIAIYGFGDSSFVSTTATVTINGASNSPSGKNITLTPNLNGKDASPATLDANGFYSFTLTLIPGDNTIVLTAKEADGLTKTKQVMVSYAPNSTIAKDFSLDVNSVAESDTKTLTAKLSFSDSSQVKTVDVLSYPAGAVVASMKDDGTLPDEIKADGLYTSNFNFTASATGNKCFRAKIMLFNGESYFSGDSCLETYTKKSILDYEISSAASDLVITKFNKLNTSSLSKQDKAAKIVGEIKSTEQFDTYFKSMHFDDKGNIFWILKSGLPGSLMVDTLGTKSIGSIENIGSDTFYYSSPHDSGSGTGFSNKYSYSLKSLKDSDFFTEIAPSLDVRDINVFKTFYNSGIVHLATHGGQSSYGTILSTGLVLPQYVCGEKKSVETFWLFFELTITTPTFCSSTNAIKEYTDNCTEQKGCLASVGGLEDGTKVALVHARYFDENLKDDFKKSLVFIDACHSFENTDMRDIFFRRGAVAFMGWNNSVLISYTRDFSKKFYESLSTGKSVNESIIVAKASVGINDGQKDNPADIHVAFNNGISDLKITDLSLKNGYFESDSISPWQQSGDARVISTLGQYLPIDGKSMGILSTGLGYTTTSGAISQKTLVQNTNSTLKFSWNYMSEEFKQYCGSSYQDYFKVTACKKDGTCDTLLNKKVDDFCSSVVQSNVVLNNGKPAVWATGWQSQIIDISGYRGKVITFKFEASDIGDSAYDTAVLLDGIKIE